MQRWREVRESGRAAFRRLDRRNGRSADYFAKASVAHVMGGSSTPPFPHSTRIRHHRLDFSLMVPLKCALGPLATGLQWNMLAKCLDKGEAAGHQLEALVRNAQPGGSGSWSSINSSFQHDKSGVRRGLRRHCGRWCLRRSPAGWPRLSDRKSVPGELSWAVLPNLIRCLGDEVGPWEAPFFAEMERLRAGSTTK